MWIRKNKTDIRYARFNFCDIGLSDKKWKENHLRKLCCRCALRNSRLIPLVLCPALLKTSITPVLCSLFSLTFARGISPKMWKNACVQKFSKKANQIIPVNYRPIALLCINSKVMEKHLENFNITKTSLYHYKLARVFSCKLWAMNPRYFSCLNKLTLK